MLVIGGTLLAGQGDANGVYTSEQAERGRAALRDNAFGACSDCHTEGLTGRVGRPDERPSLDSLPVGVQKTIANGGRVPDLVGPAFRARWAARSTKDLSANFEKRFASSLSEETRLNILAYMLSENGARPGRQPLTMTTDVRIGALDGWAP